MTTRRGFLKARSAVIAFCSCGMLDAVRAQPGGPAPAGHGQWQAGQDRRCPCPLPVPRSGQADGRRCVQSPMPETRARRAFIARIEERLKAMDARAIDIEVLSINPFWYRKDRDIAAEIVKVQNEKLAELCASKPDRFAAFASLTLQFPDLAVEQLETAMKKQGLRGAAIGGSVPGRNSPTRNSIRSGPRPRNSARCCSSTRRGSRSWPSG